MANFYARTIATYRGSSSSLVDALMEGIRCVHRSPLTPLRSAAGGDRGGETICGREPTVELRGGIHAVSRLPGAVPQGRENERVRSASTVAYIASNARK